MSDNVVISAIAGCAVVISAICVQAVAIRLWVNNRRMDDIRDRITRLDESFNAFRDVINRKLSALDTEIAKLLDRLDRR